MEAAVFFSATSEMGVFHGGFASSSSFLHRRLTTEFCGFAFLSLDTIHFGVLGVLFLIITEAATFPSLR